MERVLETAAFLDSLAAFFIQYAELQVESAKHFDQPLVNQAFGDYNEDTLSTFGDELVVKYETCLDCFSKADFIGKQDPGRKAVGNLMGDI